MIRTVKTLAAAALAATLFTGSANAAGGGVDIPSQSWSFDGVFGTFDRASAQRGLQVYRNVCAGCHGLRLVAYRNLGDLGFDEAEIKTIAAEYEVQDGPNDEGEMFARPAKPSDRFVSPFPNDNAARAGNNGALPPDLSLMVKARPNGANYVYALMTGYTDAPAGVEVADGMNYNAYFPGHQIAMAAPLFADGVEYSDGTAATVEQQARDVVTFLAWASEPELEERKRMGVMVMIFLAIFTILLFLSKRKIWARLH